MANFGWSLSDSTNPFRTGLANFRNNFMQQREEKAAPVEVKKGHRPLIYHQNRQLFAKEKQSTSLPLGLSDNSIFSKFTQMRSKKKSHQDSTCSDSCIGSSDHPSMTNSPGKTFRPASTTSDPVNSGFLLIN